MKRTIENCSVAKKYGADIEDEKCLGVRQNGDEPIEKCRECKLHIYYEED